MSLPTYDNRHGPATTCTCLVSPGCLREIRRQHLVSLDAVAAACGLSREYLAGVERGDGPCTDPAIIGAYERAIGVPVEQEILTMTHNALSTLWSMHEMLTRLYQARTQGTSPEPSHG